jgi:hypothetical protein
MPFEVREPAGDASQIGERKVRQRHGDDAARRRGLRLRRARSGGGGHQRCARLQHAMHRDAGKRSQRDEGDAEGHPLA